MSPNTWNLVTSTDMVQATADFNLSINARSLTRPHTVIILLEGVQPGTSFELEVVRHFEGPPSELGQSFEQRAVLLPDSVSSALDLIRKTNFEPVIASRLEKAMETNLSGVFNDPTIMTQDDVRKMGLLELPNPMDLVSYMVRQAPAMMSEIVGGIPIIGDILAPLSQSLLSTLFMMGDNEP